MEGHREREKTDGFPFVFGHWAVQFGPDLGASKS